MKIDRARLLVAEYIAKWPTAKILSVIAFAEAGKMDFCRPCCCLIGVASSDTLHTSDRDLVHSPGHYNRGVSGKLLVEDAYYWLGNSPNPADDQQRTRDRELIGILRAQLGSRSRFQRREPIVIELNTLESVELTEVLA